MGLLGTGHSAPNFCVNSLGMAEGKGSTFWPLLFERKLLENRRGGAQQGDDEPVAREGAAERNCFPFLPERTLCSNSPLPRVCSSSGKQALACHQPEQRWPSGGPWNSCIARGSGAVEQVSNGTWLPLAIGAIQGSEGRGPLEDHHLNKKPRLYKRNV